MKLTLLYPNRPPIVHSVSKIAIYSDNFCSTIHNNHEDHIAYITRGRIYLTKYKQQDYMDFIQAGIFYIKDSQAYIIIS